MSKVSMEDRVLAGPEVGVSSFKQNAFTAWLAVRGCKTRVNRCDILLHRYYLCFTNQSFQRQRFYAPGALDKMRRCIDMSSGVRAHMKQRDVGRVAVGERFPISDFNSRIARIGGRCFG